MDFTICYLEVFDDETNQWEYVPESEDAEPINCWYNNLDPFFDKFNLSYLFTAIENKEQAPLFTIHKGLPIDCSLPIVNAQHFYFQEITMGKSVSFIYLAELLSFDYNSSINLEHIVPIELEMLYPEIYKNKKQTVTHKEWLGEEYFIELQITQQRFGKYPNSRFVYFIYKMDLE